MNKILAVSLMGSLIFSGFVFGADFSKQTNDELVKLSGTIDPKDVLDYKKEIDKRVNNMTGNDAKAFKEKIKAQQDKVYGEMKVKDLKQRKEAIFNAIKEQCSKDPASCPKPPKMDKNPQHQHGANKPAGHSHGAAKDGAGCACGNHLPDSKTPQVAK